MRQTARDLLEKALALALGLFLLLTLFRGGNTDLAMRLAASGGLALLVLGSLLIVAAVPAVPKPAAGLLFFVAALLLLLCVGAFALLPVAASSWLQLPGRGAYADVVALLSQPDFAVATLSLSVDPTGTKRALLALAPCVVIALATNLLARRSLLRVLGAFALLATLEALIGLFQMGFRGASSLFILDYVGHARASGTFVNKNHYATFLAMALPLLIFRAAGQYAFFAHRNDTSALSNVWWGIAAAFVAAALVASLSRAGVLAGGIAAAVALALCATRLQWRSRRVALLIAIALAVLAIGLASVAGLVPLMRSVTGGGLGDGASSRFLMNSHTWTGVTAFFPLGAGLGSYSIAFQRFQTPQLLGFVEYAHNDYLQLLFETGAVGIVILLLLAAAACLAGRSLWRARGGSERLPAALACYLGALAFAIHAWFDFPSHIPATAMVATLLFAASMSNELLVVPRRKLPGKATHAPLLRKARPNPAPGIDPAPI
jgi:O-antigen ligase